MGDTLFTGRNVAIYIGIGALTAVLMTVVTAVSGTITASA